MPYTMFMRALAVVMSLSMASAALAQPDVPPPAETEDAPVAAERAMPVLDRAITELQARLERLESMREGLANGEPVTRQQLRRVIDSGRFADRGPERGPDGGAFGPSDDPMGRLAGRPGRGASTWDRPWEDLDDEHRQRVRQFLAKHSPEAYRRLEQGDSAVAERVLARALAPRAIKVIRAQEADPALGELALEEYLAGAELFNAARMLRMAFVEHGRDSDEFEEARTQFRAAIGREVDAKLAMRAHEFQQLERRLAEQREALEDERAKRDARIDESWRQVMQRIEQGEESGRPADGDRPRRGRGPR